MRASMHDVARVGAHDDCRVNMARVDWGSAPNPGIFQARRKTGVSRRGPRGLHPFGARTAPPSVCRMAPQVSLRSLLRRLHVTVPAANEKLLEGGVGGVERFAAAHIGFTVEIAVIGLVDALHLLTGLADQRGKALTVRRQGGAEIGLHQRGEFGLL